MLRKENLLSSVHIKCKLYTEEQNIISGGLVVTRAGGVNGVVGVLTPLSSGGAAAALEECKVWLTYPQDTMRD